MDWVQLSAHGLIILLALLFVPGKQAGPSGASAVHGHRSTGSPCLPVPEPTAEPSAGLLSNVLSGLAGFGLAVVSIALWERQLHRPLVLRACSTETEHKLHPHYSCA